jgi:hypothetical protein
MTSISSQSGVNSALTCDEGQERGAGNVMSVAFQKCAGMVIQPARLRYSGGYLRADWTSDARMETVKLPLPDIHGIPQ